MDKDAVVITGAARTPMGGFQGELSGACAAELGAAAIKAALERAGVSTESVEEVIMGCVLPAGQGQAPARQASIHAGISQAAGCTTVNKMCGSGMKAVMFAHDVLKAGSNDLMVAGGMESMSNAPYLLNKVRSGMRMGHGEISDHMFLDGLEDAFDKGKLMGNFAEDTAQHYQFTREAQDEFAITSLKRAQGAIEDGTFANEIVPVSLKTRQGLVEIATDEQPRHANFKKIPTLKPAFHHEGTVTAANSSSISDGAAALVMARAGEAQKRGMTPLALLHTHTTHAQAPAWFTTAPVSAIRALLKKMSWSVDEVDLFEINEAFAVVTMAAMHELNIAHEKVNIHGGACALGHPVGASGARIIVTLMNALEKYDLKRGVASLCIGGGEATAVAIERIT